MKKTIKITLITITLIALIIGSFALFFKMMGNSNVKQSDRERFTEEKGYIEETAAYAASDEYEYMDYREEFADASELELISNSEGNVASFSAPNTTTAPVNDSRMLIKTAYMTLETTNFDDLINQIDELVKDYNGYYEDSVISGTGNNRNYKSATLTIRIPNNQFDEIKSTLSSISTIISYQESTEDVTINYVDIEAHIESLRIEQETLNELLSNAEDLDTIIILQNELTSVRYEIESYESQLRTLGDLVSYSTITININEVLEETPTVVIEELRDKPFKEKLSEAFSESVEDLKIDFMDNLVVFMSMLPGIIIFVIIAAIITVTIVVIVKSAKRKAKNTAKNAETKENSSKNEENT